MADWADDPAIRDAVARRQEISAILALPEAQAQGELAARGLHPVSVAHGELDSNQAADLICGRAATAAKRHGCLYKTGGNDATTYLFPSHDAAVGFLAEVTGFAGSWWSVTATVRGVYNRGGAW